MKVKVSILNLIKLTEIKTNTANKQVDKTFLNTSHMNLWLPETNASCNFGVSNFVSNLFTAKRKIVHRYTTKLNHYSILLLVIVIKVSKLVTHYR